MPLVLTEMVSTKSVSTRPLSLIAETMGCTLSGVPLKVPAGWRVKTNLVASTSMVVAAESLATMRLPRLPRVVESAPVSAPMRKERPCVAFMATRTERR